MTIQLQPDPPIPFDTWRVDWSVTGCAPDTVATFTANRLNVYTDTVSLDPTVSSGHLTDAAGSAATGITFARAYPGEWEFSVECDGSTVSERIEVPAPDDFTVDVTPDRVVRGEPFELTVSGSGCPAGASIQWYAALHPVASWASGTTVVQQDGTWTSTGAGTLAGPGTELLDDTLGVDAYCLLDQFVSVPYPTAAIPIDEPDTTTSTVQPPSGVTPRFTG